MRVFLAIPAQDKSEEEIDKSIEEGCQNIAKIFSHEAIEINHIYLPLYKTTTELCRLAASIHNMDFSDVVYFYPGWKNDPYCQILLKVCEVYNIQRIEA